MFSLALNLTSCSLPSHTRALKLWTLLLLPHKLFFTFLHFFLCLAFLLALIVYIILLILPPTINYDIAPFFNKARFPARLVDLWVLLTTSPFTRSDTYRYTRAQSRHPTARCLRSSKAVLKHSPSWAVIEFCLLCPSFLLVQKLHHHPLLPQATHLLATPKATIRPPLSTISVCHLAH